MHVRLIELEAGLQAGVECNIGPVTFSPGIIDYQ